MDKTANAYEYQVGDKVQYKVIVRNTKDYTVAQNVVVSDISLPDGLDIADETGIQVHFSPETAASQIGLACCRRNYIYQKADGREPLFC